jgi:sucrose-6-phosphate hydrolase SacC (GH32 family)
MVFPVELTLHRTEEGLRLFANPVREIKALWSETSLIGQQALKPGGNNPLAGVQGDLLDITADIIPNKAEKVAFQIHGVSVAFNVRSNTLSCLNKTGPLQPQDGMIKLRFLVDRASIEIFGNDGRLYMPMGIISKEPGQPLRIYSEGGEARIKHLEVHYLRSAWEDMGTRNSSKQNNVNAGVESPGK